MTLDVLILSNDQVLFSEASENVKKFFGATPKVLNDAKSIARGYNTLARQSDADILCFMHQDARVIFPVDVIYDYFKGLPKVGVLGFCGSARQVPGKQWWECQPTYGALTQGQGDQAKPLTFNSPTRFTPQGKHGYQPVQTVDGYCLFIKREVFEKLHGFDEEYTDWHGYDLDLCAKALDAGLQNYVIQQPSIHFSWGGGGPALDAALTRFKEKWDMRFSELNRPVKLVARALPAQARAATPGKLKIVVYTICKNELQFCERFAKSCKDADGVYVLDTGSTDGTPEKLQSLGVNVEVQPFDGWKTLEEHDKLVAEGKNPWRFDVARNLSIDMCPPDADVLVCIDMDEVLVPGWRKIIEDAWAPGTNHMSYLFAWSMIGDKPHHCFWYEKFHSRHEYVWVSPVHEAIVPKHGIVDHRVGVGTCLVHHYPDPSKSRAQYLALLELAVREAPNDPRVRFYLGREYTFVGRYQDAINSHIHLLAMPNAKTTRERANACQQIAACYGYLKDMRQQFNWLLRAITEEPGQREPWVDLADYCRLTGDHLLSYWAAKKALAIPVSACDNNYLVDPACWKEKPHDIASIAAWWGWNANQREESLQEAWEALGCSPWDGRLEGNYRLLQNLLAKPVSTDPSIVDVIMLSYAKTGKEYTMAKEAIQSLRNSSPAVPMRFVVVETNQKLAEEPFTQADKGKLFGGDVEVCYPGGTFGFNKFLKVGFDQLNEMPHRAPESRYLVVMNNDVTLFNPGFMSHMLEGMKSVASASPLGLREATLGLVRRDVPIDENYDINRAVNGWFIMFDKKIMNALPFETLFPAEFTWYHGDVHYAQLLEKCGYRHGMINAAQALHLQRQSHALREGLEGPTGPAFTGDAVGSVNPPDRNVMLKLLNLKGKSCVEIGVECGLFAEVILAEEPKSLVLVDLWQHQDYSVYPDTSNVANDEFERRLQVVKKKFDGDPRVTICRAFSVQAAKLYDRDSLDFAYIDANHTEAACYADMCAWWPTIKPGGWMCGHDYSFPDVAAAVKTFVAQNHLTLNLVTRENGPATSWGLRKPEAAPVTGENDERNTARNTA